MTADKFIILYLYTHPSSLSFAITSNRSYFKQYIHFTEFLKMSDSNRPPDTIETLFSSLTPENQATVLQQLLETMKPPRSTTPPPNPFKHNLESPITPSKGKGRKVIEKSFIN